MEVSLARAASPRFFPTLLATTILVFVLGSSPAQAQSWIPSWIPPWASSYLKNIGVGVSVVRVIPVDRKIDSDTAPGATVGFAPQVGWGFVIGLGSFRVDLRTSGVKVGYLRVAPLMAGVGYTWVHDQLALKTSAAAGIIFNDAAIDHAVVDPITGPVTADLSKRFAARLTFGVEYALVRKLALRGAVNYTPIYPSFVVKTLDGVTRGTWNPSNFSLQAAFVVYPLR